ncbi:hypothetical protein [Paenibacillus sp. YIM B09110]|uniref:hypothetical protein n=1 Tax=Paenibacillus sp. YIM B09110 TaxID=3126102 RepID=UPI003FA70D06
MPYDKSKKVLVIVSLAFFMVSGMVLCMSLFGLAMAYFADQLHGNSLFQSYVSNVWHNYVIALPLQLIVMGPLVRYLFVKFVKNKMSAQPVG